MMMMQIGERHRQRVGIGAPETCAAEHQGDVVIKDVGRDPGPQQLHRRSLAVGRVDAGAAELEDLLRDRRRAGAMSNSAAE